MFTVQCALTTPCVLGYPTGSPPCALSRRLQREPGPADGGRAAERVRGALVQRRTRDDPRHPPGQREDGAARRRRLPDHAVPGSPTACPTAARRHIPGNGQANPNENPQSGTDTATWNASYGYTDRGRPMFPATFVTDLTGQRREQPCRRLAAGWHPEHHTERPVRNVQGGGQDGRHDEGDPRDHRHAGRRPAKDTGHSARVRTLRRPVGSRR